MKIDKNQYIKKGRRYIISAGLCNHVCFRVQTFSAPFNLEDATEDAGMDT